MKVPGFDRRALHAFMIFMLTLVDRKAACSARGCGRRLSLGREGLKDMKVLVLPKIFMSFTHFMVERVERPAYRISCRTRPEIASAQIW